MTSIERKKQQILRWLNRTDDESVLSKLEALIKQEDADAYQRYVVPQDEEALNNLVEEAEQNISKGEYLSQEQVKQLFNKA